MHNKARVPAGECSDGGLGGGRQIQEVQEALEGLGDGLAVEDGRHLQCVAWLNSSAISGWRRVGRRLMLCI